MKIFNYSFYVFFFAAFSLSILSCGDDDNDMGDNIMETCDDGIQNQDETGIDCGGICSPCGPPTSGYYIYGIVDGEEVVVSGNPGYGENSCLNNISSINTGWVDLSDVTNPRTIAMVGFIRDLTNPSTSQEDIYNSIILGSQSFGSCSNGLIGIEFRWADENGVLFTTEGNQSGSNFELTSKGEFPGNIANYIDLEGTFNCKIYNNGEVKELTNGQFRLSLLI